MKKVKKVIIFIVINVVMLAITIGIPSIPSKKAYDVNMLRTPSSAELAKSSGKHVYENIHLFWKIARTLEGDEKDIYNSLLKIVFNERPELSLKYASQSYLLFGSIIGVFGIVIGIILRYKSKNHVYANAFILSGIITIVYYINIFYLISINYEFRPWSEIALIINKFLLYNY